ncbi:Rha family transcriptional regulator [Pseudomonas sediminis]|uniref:Rha family transcriptional regulator n=1 Tax=Pseudomonas sediminis TaxID=1691904 RepID=UPI0031CCC5B0
MTNTTATIFESISKAEAVSPTTLNGLPGMSSLEIAEITGKHHRHVLRDISKMLSELELDVNPNLGAPQHVGTQYRDVQGKLRPLTILDKELTFTLLSRYSFKLSNMIVKRWLELEGSGFERVSVQAAVVHLIEREKDNYRIAMRDIRAAARRLKAR